MIRVMPLRRELSLAARDVRAVTTADQRAATCDVIDHVASRCRDAGIPALGVGELAELSRVIRAEGS